MIFVGYQGIGKSTLAKKDKRYIDLESSSFFVNGKRSDDWYVPYCNIAIRLSDQGYDVFISSHKVVRDYISSLSEHIDIDIVYPALSLKNEWITKLKRRYEETRLGKDFKAWKNAEHAYESNILDLMNQDGTFCKIEIRSMDYDLKRMLEYGDVLIAERGV